MRGHRPCSPFGDGNSDDRPGKTLARSILSMRMLFLVFAVAFTLVIEAIFPVVVGGVAYSGSEFEMIGILASLAVDAPLAPVFTVVLYPSMPDSALAFLLVTGCIAIPFHGVVGFVIGWIENLVRGRRLSEFERIELEIEAARRAVESETLP